ncbi:hypothetical protein ACFYRG_28105 [Streptomyces mirabilis]|uniref:hypothetical protein n=1 Tax=Streptomyces mirabilis TaxID=68239 RepID=UPI0036907298
MPSTSERLGPFRGLPAAHTIHPLVLSGKDATPLQADWAASPYAWSWNARSV